MEANFGESDRSLEHEFRSIERYCLLPVSHWVCDNTFVFFLFCIRLVELVELDEFN